MVFTLFVPFCPVLFRLIFVSIVFSVQYFHIWLYDFSVRWRLAIFTRFSWFSNFCFILTFSQNIENQIWESEKKRKARWPATKMLLFHSTTKKRSKWTIYKFINSLKIKKNKNTCKWILAKNSSKTWEDLACKHISHHFNHPFCDDFQWITNLHATSFTENHNSQHSRIPRKKITNFQTNFRFRCVCIFFFFVLDFRMYIDSVQFTVKIENYKISIDFEIECQI